MNDKEMICYNCMKDDIIGTLCDGLWHEEEIKIRREYKKLWGPNYLGELYPILNEALEFSCFNCGNGGSFEIAFDALSEEMKKRAQKIMKKYCVTLKESGNKIRICPRCEGYLLSNSLHRNHRWEDYVRTRKR